MRSTSAKLEKWFGGIEVNRPSRFMISGSVSSTVLVGVSVCLPFLHIPSPRELNGFSGAGTLAFAIRSGINLILLFARIRNLPRFVQPLPGLKSRSDAVFDQEGAYLAHAACAVWSRLVPFRCHARFAQVSPLTELGVSLQSFTGSFVALYRILLNAFPLLFPANIPILLSLRNLAKRLTSASDFRDSAIDDLTSFSEERGSSPDDPPVTVKERAARLSFVAQAHQTWLRKRSARWHSIVAGAVAGGVAIAFENMSRRKVIAQQLFVRRVIQYASRCLAGTHP